MNGRGSDQREEKCVERREKSIKQVFAPRVESKWGKRKLGETGRSHRICVHGEGEREFANRRE